MKDKFLRHLKFEKRVSENTIKSYDNDLSQFLTFSEKYENNRKLSSYIVDKVISNLNERKLKKKELDIKKKSKVSFNNKI